jgi:DNA recombination protein Rad52
MTFTNQQVEQLSAPLSRSHVKQRSQAGRQLSYIEGWVAISEANRIFGFGGWTSETIECRLVAEKERKIGRDQRPGWSVSYVTRVRISVGPLVREGFGAGHGIDVDLGLAHESAIKESETDARKRALMTFGNPFGLALYDKDQAQVSDDARPNGAEPAPPATTKAKRPLAAITVNGEQVEPEKSAYQARKDGDWPAFMADLQKHSADTEMLIRWVPSRLDRLQRHPWYGKALEEWRSALVEALGKECHSPSELSAWRNNSFHRLAGLPLDWKLAASGAIEDATANHQVPA